MKFKIYVTRDFGHMSQVAANIVIGKITDFIPTKEKPYLNLILPTGSSPTGMYKRIIEQQDSLDFSFIVSHNLDEYIGLPGTTITDRIMYPESYGSFMIKKLFGSLSMPFHEWHVPRGCEIEQSKLEEEIEKYRDDEKSYYFQGIRDGKQGLVIVIPDSSESEYLRWIKREILDSYLNSIKSRGKVDLSIIGVGGRGHIAFHESGIPLDLEMLLVKLDENTTENAAKDGHFKSVEESPKYAVSLGAGFVYNPEYNREILLLANGERKREPINEALFGDVTELVPISGCKKFAESGKVIWVVDETAGKDIFEKKSKLLEKGILIADLRH